MLSAIYVLPGAFCTETATENLTPTITDTTAETFTATVALTPNETLTPGETPIASDTPPVTATTTLCRRMELPATTTLTMIVSAAKDRLQSGAVLI